ncbi:hypothetical protein BC628DRAFT_1067827 [Trametes gibbosa]|nr:hypothetical protein BC628DRAFT_1067827 [Trametes gibbosa]
MSSFSSLSSIGRSPAPPASHRQFRTDDGHDSRPCTPRSQTHTKPRSHYPRPPPSPVGVSRGQFTTPQKRLPSSSTMPAFPPSTPPSGKAGHSGPHVQRRPSANASHNEVSPVFRVSDSRRRTDPLQAHQSVHAPSERTTGVSPLVWPAGFLNQAPSLSSSLTSVPSLAAPPTPQSLASPVRLHGYRREAFITPATSHTTLHSECRSSQVVRAQREPLTPSPSPRSHGPQRLRPNTRSSPLVPPRPFTVRRGLVLPRARATLAMSLQVHTPTPIMSSGPLPRVPSSTRPRSRSRPPSSPSSSPLTSSVPLPPRPPMARPPSRSERLLRDTLRRVEEQERISKPHASFTLSPPPPTSNIPPSVVDMFATCRLPAAAHSGRRHRRNTSSSARSDSSCDFFDSEPLDEDSQEEEDGRWLWDINSAGALASASVHRSPAYHPTRLPHGRKEESIPYGTPSSPSPAQAQLQRAAKSTPTVPRRHSHSQSASHVTTHPPPRSPVDREHSSPSARHHSSQLTPHEVVLRSKLEGILKNTANGGSRTRSTERRGADHGLSSGSGNSMASSRNLSVEGDFFFGASSDPSLTSLSSTDSKAASAPKSRESVPSSPRRARASLNMPAPPLKTSRRQTHSPTPHKGGVGPLTPPPSPPFDVSQAAAHVKNMDGYISFANIEGLGVPHEADEDEKSRSRWFQWLSSGKGPIVHDRP